MKIEDLLVEGTTRRFRITNADGKAWLMPAKNMSMSMTLYQPGSAKGKMLKRLLPHLYRIPGVLKFLKADEHRVELIPEIKDVIGRAFSVDDFEWSLFGGTPCVHQKITIQIFRGHELLGYVKVSDSEDISRLFEHEKSILDSIIALDVPRVLWEGRVGNYYVFVQNTKKTLESREIHFWKPEHEEFLCKLRDMTIGEYRYEETDYAETLRSVEPWLDRLPSFERGLIKHAIDSINSAFADKMVRFSMYHADFTPWNMVEIGDERLFVFDWEYAKRSYPPMLDKWHFQLQSAIFERHLSDEQIVALIKNHPEKTSLRLYLLDMICRFTVREKAVFIGDMKRSFNLWIKLLQI